MTAGGSVSREDPGVDPAVRLIASACGPGVRYLGVVLELAPRIDIWTRMKAEHTSTPQGFCSARVCGRAGTGIPHLAWPCPTRRLADRAAAAHDRSTSAGRVDRGGSARRPSPSDECC